MVVRNKLCRVIATYRRLLASQLKRGIRTPGGNQSKNKILNFYLRHARWPRRQAKNKREATLGTRLENFICPSACGYDKNLRHLVLAAGRKPNGKRSHNKKGFKQEILDFITANGRVPARYREQKIPGEGTLREKLDFYTLTQNDMSFLGKIYALDPCHRSGIGMKYRQVINEALDVEKPLIRLVK